MRRLLVRGLTAAAVLALAWSLAAWLGGGLEFTLAGFRLTSTNVTRPFAAGVVAAVVALFVNGFRASVDDAKAMAGRLTPYSAAALLAIATTVLSLLTSSWTASGPDSYAYLSHAAILREGRLSHTCSSPTRQTIPGACERERIEDGGIRSPRYADVRPHAARTAVTTACTRSGDAPGRTWMCSPPAKTISTTGAAASAVTCTGTNVFVADGSAVAATWLDSLWQPIPEGPGRNPMPSGETGLRFAALAPLRHQARHPPRTRPLLHRHPPLQAQDD